MLLDKVYNDFVSHTNLTDSVYRSVFVKVSELLTKVQNVKFEYLIYSDPEYGVKEVSFKDKTAQKYVVDLYLNIFKGYYTLPTESFVKLGISYTSTKGVQQLEIVDTSLGVQIPEELMFLKDLNLFSMFIVDRPVYDIAGAFDQEFKFMDSFKTPVTDVFQPLRKKLEKTDAIVQTAHNSLNINTVASTQLQVENLRQKINDLLPKIELIRKTRENCFKDKHSVVTGVNARETLMAEKEKLTMELETMSRSHKLNQSKKEKYEEVVGEIDKVLVDLSHGMEGRVSPAAKEYIEKKVAFKQEMDYLDTSLADYKRIISDLAIRIKSITEELEKIDGYTTADTEAIDNKIDRLNKEQEELYSILSGLEGALRQQTELLHTSSVRLEQADSYMNAAVQNVEDTAIVSHLSTPVQPISVTTVMNYLRYYYFYHATLITKDLLTAYETDVYTAQAIACKLVLMRNFGLYLHQMISYAEFMDNRLGTVISIVKD